MSRMPPRLRSSFSSSLVRISASFLGMASKSPADRMRSYSCIFFTRSAMVVKFVSIPPSQRSLTYGIPHSCAERGDRVLGLLLGAYEENTAAVGHQVPHERIGHVDALQRLVQVDDVNAVALAEDKALHLRVPAPGLVPEMDSRL